MQFVLGLIREDLAAIRISFDRWSSEKALYESGTVDRFIRSLEEKDLVYVGKLPPPKSKKGAQPIQQPHGDLEEGVSVSEDLLLFRSSQYGDEVDRPVKKADGTPTYFCADIAYHWDKRSRADALVDVLGADHGGYVPRLEAALDALGASRHDLHVVLIQMVNLTRGGEAVKMSKRAGTVVSLREVVDEVGADAARFIFLTRRSDAQLDFDVELAKRQTLDNPVFYVQYGHARLAAIFQKAREAGVPDPAFDLDAARTLTGPGGAGSHPPHRLVPRRGRRRGARVRAAPDRLLAAGDDRGVPLVLHAGEEDGRAGDRPGSAQDRRPPAPLPRAQAGARERPRRARRRRAGPDGESGNSRRGRGRLESRLMREPNPRVRAREKFELSLDGRQVASIVVGALVVLGVVFVLGLNVGKQLAVRRVEAGRAGDLDALDRAPRAPPPAKPEPLTFHDRLTKDTPAPPPPPEPAAKPPPPAPPAAAPAPRRGAGPRPRARGRAPAAERAARRARQAWTVQLAAASRPRRGGAARRALRLAEPPHRGGGDPREGAGSSASASGRSRRRTRRSATCATWPARPARRVSSRRADELRFPR